MKQRRHTPEQVIRKLSPRARNSWRRADDRRGTQVPRDLRSDLAPLAKPIRREDRRRQAAERAREGERQAQEAPGRGEGHQNVDRLARSPASNPIQCFTVVLEADIRLGASCLRASDSSPEPGR
jgi:hypothetical protein